MTIYICPVCLRKRQTDQVPVCNRASLHTVYVELTGNPVEVTMLTMAEFRQAVATGVRDPRWH